MQTWLVWFKACRHYESRICDDSSLRWWSIFLWLAIHRIFEDSFSVKLRCSNRPSSPELLAQVFSSAGPDKKWILLIISCLFIFLIKTNLSSTSCASLENTSQCSGKDPSTHCNYSRRSENLNQFLSKTFQQQRPFWKRPFSTKHSLVYTGFFWSAIALNPLLRTAERLSEQTAALYEVTLIKRLIRAWILNERTQSPNNIHLLALIKRPANDVGKQEWSAKKFKIRRCL